MSLAITAVRLELGSLFLKKDLTSYCEQLGSLIHSAQSQAKQSEFPPILSVNLSTGSISLDRTSPTTQPLQLPELYSFIAVNVGDLPSGEFEEVTISIPRVGLLDDLYFEITRNDSDEAITLHYAPFDECVRIINSPESKQ